MHNCVPLGLPFFSLAQMGHYFPRTYLPGSGQPLRPHVCDFDYGRSGHKPQEGRQKQELHLESVLYEQGTWTLVNGSCRGVLTAFLDRPVPLLRSERTLLHRHVPPFFLVAILVSVSSSSHEQRYHIHPSTWKPCCSTHAPLLRQSLQRRCIGICAS
jgi:hypothetical protein